MRYLLLIMILLSGAAHAGDFDDAFTRKVEPRPLFEPGIERGGQLINQYPESSNLLFGAGMSLGIADDPIGFGVGFWFDVYFAPFLAASTRYTITYGIITNDYEGGGDAFATAFSIGAKFVFDFPNSEVTRWFRPWVGLYPVGFMFVDAIEDVKLPGEPTRRFSYSDVYFLMQGGGGVDIFLTGNLAIGAALYVTGTFGGSTHRKDGITIKTRGGVGIFFEYINLTVRF